MSALGQGFQQQVEEIQALRDELALYKLRYKTLRDLNHRQHGCWCWRLPKLGGHQAFDQAVDNMDLTPVEVVVHPV